MLRVMLFGAFFAAVTPQFARGSEIEGFRLGMSIEQIKQVASEKGYTFSNAIRSSPNSISYILMKGGPSISLCNNVLSAVDKTNTSNLHVFTSLLAQWTTSLGIPEVTTSQNYIQGVQRSSVGFQWLGLDNVRRTISISKLGSRTLQISFGYGYIYHPCRQFSLLP